MNSTPANRMSRVIERCTGEGRNSTVGWQQWFRNTEELAEEWMKETVFCVEIVKM